MVIGMEFSLVTTVKGKRQCVALCCQHGPNLKNHSSYATSNKVDELRRQKIKGLDTLVLQCLKDYEKKYKTLPKNVVFYRMGLSEAQMYVFVDEELLCIKEVLSREFGSKRPSVIFIIVNKKINDRFFTLDMKNPEGVIVCSDVTRAKRAEFYMIPQTVREGTATPSKYQIVDMDNSRLAMEDIMELTYQLCFDYLNWSGAINVPSVLKSAETLSKMISLIKCDKIGNKLRTCAFYL